MRRVARPTQSARLSEPSLLCFRVFVAQQFRLLLRDPFQQFRRRFVVPILRHQLAVYSEAENGLAQLADLVRARGERLEDMKCKAGVIAEFVRIGRVEAGEARRSESIALRLLPRPHARVGIYKREISLVSGPVQPYRLTQHTSSQLIQVPS